MYRFKFILLVFVVMLGGMTAFEVVKEWLLPNMGIWQSHAVKIVFSGVIAVGLGLCIFTRWKDGSTAWLRGGGTASSATIADIATFDKYLGSITDKHARSRFRLAYATMPFVVFGVSMFVLLVFMSNMGTVMVRQTSSMVYDSTEIKDEIRLFHQGFERMIMGQPIIGSKDVWKHFDNAKSYIANIRNYVQAGLFSLSPLYGKAVVARVGEFSPYIDGMEKIRRRLERQSEKVVIGSDMELELDRNIEGIIEQSKKFDVSL